MNVTIKITNFFVYILLYLAFQSVFINFGVYPIRYTFNFSAVAAPYIDKFAVTKLECSYILPNLRKRGRRGMSFWFVAKDNTHKYNLAQTVAFSMEQLISYISLNTENAC